MKLIDIDYLREWHAKNYSANLLNVCVLGKEGLDTLGEYCREMFEPVPNLESISSTSHGAVFPESLMSSLVQIK